MSEFNKWVGDNFYAPYDVPTPKQAFEAGQQSQQAKIDDLTELNRLKTIALEQSVNRTSVYVHEKIVALENKLKGNKDETII